MTCKLAIAKAAREACIAIAMLDVPNQEIAALIGMNAGYFSRAPHARLPFREPLRIRIESALRQAAALVPADQEVRPLHLPVPNIRRL
jgi:hypothetical protein